MSTVFQKSEYQFPAATVAEESVIGPHTADMTGKEIAPLINGHPETLDLARPAYADPMTLSSGGKHRLSMATALVSAPELLILDEPTFDQDHST